MCAYKLPTYKAEQFLIEKGYALIAGVDEAGAGCWAGPVFAGAVILRGPIDDKLIRDSKTLSPDQRTRAAKLIRREALAWAVGSVSAKEIDNINIRRASELAMIRAVRNLPLSPDFVLADFRELKGFSIPNYGITEGDARSMSIAAGSIIAKTERDLLLESLDEQYPGYGFAAHKGYGTKIHQEALDKFGPCFEHRMSYKPVKTRCKVVAQ